METKAYVAIGLVFLGCMGNVVFLEALVVEDPGIGNLITFLQFLYIAVHGFIVTMKWGAAPTHINLYHYFVLVGMFFLVSVANNYAFDFNVPMPLHIIFRAGSLIANMVMGIIILRKEYSITKYISVLMITAGIIICTIVSGSEVKNLDTRGPATTPQDDFFWWTLGIGLLTFALFLSARMGIYQEVLYQKFGKHPEEALFYTHAMSLPLFLPMMPNIWKHWLIAFESTPLVVLGLPAIPKTLALLAGNVLTQYVCISSVYVLTTECASLTVTLVITLRKFASLLFSIAYFGNAFTLSHWMGTTLVFIGTIMFVNLTPQAMWSMVSKRHQS